MKSINGSIIISKKEIEEAQGKTPEQKDCDFAKYCIERYLENAADFISDITDQAQESIVKTDEEAFVELLNKFGLQYSIRETGIDGGEEVTCYEKNVEGYAGATACFFFAKNGSCIGMGTWIDKDTP